VSEADRAHPETDPYIGRRLAERYDILFKLGSGGQASVYAARHAHLGRKVAVKLLHGRRADSLAGAELILREARVMGGLGHPHICEARDAGVAQDGTPFLVLELLTGRSLAQEIERVGRMSGRRAVDIAHQVGSALQAAHALGIVHRDLKPENVWLVGTMVSDQVKVLDFGIARETTRESAGVVERFVGTPGYAAPEMSSSPLGADFRVDVYGLGVLLHEMLTGAVPSADTGGAGKAEVAGRRAEALARLRPDLPPALAAIVLKAMARDPDDRFASMAEMLTALENLTATLRDTSDLPEVVRREPPSSKPPTPPAPLRFGAPPRRRRGLLAAAALVLGIGAAAALWAPPRGEVALEIASAAPGAVARFRGAELALPHRARVARHTEPEPLEVLAPGHRPRQVLLALDRDQSLQVTLEPLPPPATPTPEVTVPPAATGEEARAVAEGPAGGAAPGPDADVGPARGRPRREDPVDRKRAQRGRENPRTRPSAAVRSRAAEAPAAAGREAPAAPPPALPAPWPEVAALSPAAPVPAPSSAPPAPPALAPQVPAPEFLDPAALQQLARQHRGEIEGCISEDPSVGGKLVLALLVRPDGTVASAKPRGGGSAPVRRCIVKLIQSWRLPAPGREAAGVLSVELE